MRFVIVTGMSGAGKSTALKILEDAGYFCADNIPLPLVEKFAELSGVQEDEYTNSYSKVALGVDIRAGAEIVIKIIPLCTKNPLNVSRILFGR